MKAIITKNFKTKNTRVTKGTLVDVIPAIGINGIELVKIVGENFEMRTLKQYAFELTNLK
jgi:hypothetical protein